MGPFRVHPIRVAHSVLDSLALAIETPAGVVVASGDFKIDEDAPEDERTDLEALWRVGRPRRARAPLRQHQRRAARATPPARTSVVPAFRDVFERTRGRVLVSCFATSIPRIQRVADLAVEPGRPHVAFARAVGWSTTPRWRWTSASCASPESAPSHPGALAERRPRAVAFVSGSQGEPLSALSDRERRTSTATWRWDRATPSCSRRAPSPATSARSRGSSATCSAAGATSSTPASRGFTSPATAARTTSSSCCGCVRPRYLVPIHGEYRMLAQHARLAAGRGTARPTACSSPRTATSCAFGDGRGGRRPAPARAACSSTAAGTAEIEDVVVRDRRHLSADGIVVPVVVLDRQTGAVESPPEIVTPRLRGRGRGPELLDEAARVARARPWRRGRAEERLDPALTRERVRARAAALLPQAHAAPAHGHPRRDGGLSREQPTGKSDAAAELLGLVVLRPVADAAHQPRDLRSPPTPPPSSRPGAAARRATSSARSARSSPSCSSRSSSAWPRCSCRSCSGSSAGSSSGAGPSRRRTRRRRATLLLLLSLAAFLTLTFGTRRAFEGEPVRAGGAVGELVAGAPRRRTSTAPGAYIVVATSLFVSLILSTQFSFARLPRRRRRRCRRARARRCARPGPTTARPGARSACAGRSIRKHTQSREAEPEACPASAR